MLNPIYLDCQSDPNPLQIYDWQSKSTIQNGLTIQSKSNHNPTKFFFFKLINFHTSVFLLCIKIWKVPRDFGLPQILYEHYQQKMDWLWRSTVKFLSSKYSKILIFRDLDWIGIVGLTIQIQIHFSYWIDNPIQIQSQSN